MDEIIARLIFTFFGVILTLLGIAVLCVAWGSGSTL